MISRAEVKRRAYAAASAEIAATCERLGLTEGESLDLLSALCASAAYAVAQTQGGGIAHGLMHLNAVANCAAQRLHAMQQEAAS
ncbi:hypothetical protein [Asaia sp. HumB]|uniref:hypothetical protein n=1 Tax=Asaia sp. HumB TaxID=3035475 RepID=UPI002553E063|nr:hypothetical protein [Asaia sp. HumB]MDL2172025.1 hypothetical protein [Asaia sp. HumB]